MWNRNKANQIGAGGAAYKPRWSLPVAGALIMFAGWIPSTCLWRPADRAGAIFASEPRRFELKGVVKSVDRPNRSATIKHEKVGDYMPAMTMAYSIRDDKALSEIREGDEVKAIVVVSEGGDMWLENLVITSRATGR
jgi:Cu/Ag efflux protein CusF